MCYDYDYDFVGDFFLDEEEDFMDIPLNDLNFTQLHKALAEITNLLDERKTKQQELLEDAIMIWAHVVPEFDPAFEELFSFAGPYDVDSFDKSMVKSFTLATKFSEI